MAEQRQITITPFIFTHISLYLCVNFIPAILSEPSFEVKFEVNSGFVKTTENDCFRWFC